MIIHGRSKFLVIACSLSGAKLERLQLETRASARKLTKGTREGLLESL